jgi:hypothetical protein
MVGVRGRTGGHGTGEIPRRYGVGGGAANAKHIFHPVDDLARPHVAVAATGSAGAEKTGRHPPRFDAVIGSPDVLGHILGENLLRGDAGKIRAPFTSISFDSHYMSSASWFRM